MAIKRKEDLDGAMTVSQTEAECEQIERDGFQLTDIRFGTKTKSGKVFLINKTVFEEKLIGRLDDLHFYELKTDDDDEKIKNIKKEKKELGWTFILKTEIYAENLTKNVLIFGKKS